MGGSNAGGMNGGMMYTNVDVAKVRGHLDTLRGYLDRMLENNRLSIASGDFVQADSFRRNNEMLLDSASSLSMTALDQLGAPANIPVGLGNFRNHVSMIVNHLTHARLMTDYSTPIAQAKDHLDKAYMALDMSQQSMSGGNMAGSMGGMRTNMGNSGTNNMGSGQNSGMNTTDPTENQSNPGLNNYNQQNDAGAGQGGVTSTPNTTPGEPGPMTGDD